MIKMYVMHTCPDCEYVEKQVEGNPDFEVIDIGKHVRNLKQFIKLRDTNPAFDEAKAVDDLGIPCYVLEDGTVTLYSKDVGLTEEVANSRVNQIITGLSLKLTLVINLIVVAMTSDLMFTAAIL